MIRACSLMTTVLSRSAAHVLSRPLSSMKLPCLTGDRAGRLLLNETPLSLVASRSYAVILISPNSSKLWEGVAGPPGGAKKRARGKRRVTRARINLNRGQRVGKSQSGMVWPGLTSNTKLTNEDGNIMSFDPIQGEVDVEYFDAIKKERNKTVVKKSRIKVPPLLRGWTGGSIAGQNIGPPENTEDQDFNGFKTIVLYLKIVATMRATTGRTRRFAALVITGNGNGLAGLGMAKSKVAKSALARAKKLAANNLEYFDIRDDRTLWHNAFHQEWYTKIYAYPKPPGSNIVAHRAVKAMCEVVGIKDIYVKVEGRTKNYNALCRGFIKMLRKQENYQKLADRERLHVVELRSESDSYPIVLASPSSGEVRDVDPSEVTDLSSYYFDGQVPLIKPAYKPSYWNNPGNKKHAAIRYRFRNQDMCDRDRKVYDFFHGSKEELSSKLN